MNITLNCKLSLSKKLRALVGKDASLTLVSQDIVDGKGTALLTLNSDSASSEFDPNMGETSIMLVPVEVAEESPNALSPVHATIFSTIPQKHQQEPLVQKLAAVNAPDKYQVPKAIKKEAKIPNAFSELKNTECTSYIKNMEELVNAINVAKGKMSNIDIDSANNDRERAVLQELKDKEESIDIPAWIVNDKVGMMSINDLKISLPLNVPYDLSNVSAKRIAMSRELKGLLREGMIKFISPKEKDKFIMSVTEEIDTNSGLAVFDNHEQAMDSIGDEVAGSRSTPVIDDRNAMYITESDVENKTEDESMILNLTQNMPNVRAKRELPEGNRKTVHGNSTPTTKNPNIKPIRKLE